MQALAGLALRNESQPTPDRICPETEPGLFDTLNWTSPRPDTEIRRPERRRDPVRHTHPVLDNKSDNHTRRPNLLPPIRKREHSDTIRSDTNHDQLQERTYRSTNKR